MKWRLSRLYWSFTMALARRRTTILPAMTLAEAVDMPRIPRVGGPFAPRTTPFRTWA
jgi:hypothetical protein